MVLEERAISRATPMVTSHGVPFRREVSPHNTLFSRDAVPLTHYLTTWYAQIRWKGFCHNKTYLQWIWKHNWRMQCCFDTNDCWNFHEPCQWLALVTRASLRYTQDYLTPGICSIIKPAAMGHWYHFPLKSTQSFYSRKSNRNAAFTMLIQFINKIWLIDPICRVHCRCIISYQCGLPSSTQYTYMNVQHFIKWVLF